MAVQDCRITVAAANYKVRPGSPTGSVAIGEFHAERTYRVVWEDRHTFIRDVLGFPQAGVLHRPQQYVAENSNLPVAGVYAVRATYKPIKGINATTGSYEFADIDVEYELPSYDVQDVRRTTGLTASPQVETYITETMEPAAEFLTLTHEGLHWYDGTPLGAVEAPALISRYTDWVYTLHQLPFIGIPAEWFFLAGCVNSTATYSRRWNKWFAAETLLAGSPTIETEVTSIGTARCSVTFRFTHKNQGTYAVPIGWNHFPQPNKAGAALNWSRIYMDATHTTARIWYPLVDFRKVIA